MVVAETARQAQDVLELIAVVYALLDCVVEARHALEHDAPNVWPENASGNLGFIWRVGNAEKTERALADAAHVVTLDLVNNRLAPNSMETRGVMVRRDAKTGNLTLSGSIQNPFGFQGSQCELFGWPKSKLWCKADDVGGGFGCQNQLQPEHAMVLFACDKLHRNIKWINDRSESFVSDAHARDLATTSQYLNGGPRCLHQHRAGRRLLRGGSARSDLFAGTHDRCRGPRNRHFAGQIAPK